MREEENEIMVKINAQVQYTSQTQFCHFLSLWPTKIERV